MTDFRPHAKSWLFGKDSNAGRDWGQEEKGTTEGEMAGWHHWLDGRESGSTPGVGDGQGGLACCNSWGRKESDTTERLNWTELKFSWYKIIDISVSLLRVLKSWNVILLGKIHFLPFPMDSEEASFPQKTDLNNPRLEWKHLPRHEDILEEESQMWASARLKFGIWALLPSS